MENKNYPHIIRVAFGNCFANAKMRREIRSTIRLDNGKTWDKLGGPDNVTWFTNGENVTNTLKEHGAKNVIMIDKRPLVHNPSVSFWYNKTMLILAAYKEFGDKAKILYLDCDVTCHKQPDLSMVKMLSDKIASGSKILSPVRLCVHPKRIMLPSKPDANKRTCPCNCFMYCEDGSILKEMLDLYPEVASLYQKGNTMHWTGTETTLWDDETLSMYWFDKSSNSDCSTQKVVDAFEPPSTIVLERHPPTEATSLKDNSLVYFQHH